ncbi:MAG: DNA-3-methyladenine glycosylase I [Myxococcota bacterium]|nr:DNA-3-methyladenine glycosylase I [Myxococcota bacterium]
MKEPIRCTWPGTDPAYVRYHDEEWARPRISDRELYERICLEGFQAGLAWITILRKRPAFREVFLDFDLEKVAAFGKRDVQRLMGDARIVRSQPKIEAAIQNARAAIGLIGLEGSLAKVIWAHAPGKRTVRKTSADIPAITAESTALSKFLRKAGFNFVGPTTLYALLQAAGVVNDHLARCHVRLEVEAEQLEASARVHRMGQGGASRP